MDTFEEAKCPVRPRRWRDTSPVELFRAAVGLILLLAALSAGLVGCAPSSGRPELVAPSVVHVSRDPHSTPGTSELHAAEKRAADVTVTFDADDLKGIAIIRPAMDACPVHLPVFRCKRQDGNPAQEGGTPAVSLTIRDTGDLPARGVALFTDTRDGLTPAGKHSNCPFLGGPSRWCRLPPGSVVIPPGATYRLGTREVLRAGRDATYPSVSFQAAALGTDYVPPDQPASQHRPGDGSALRLVPAEAQDTGAAHRSSPELKASVRNEADLVAVADTVKGPIGSLAKVRVGVRNDGPGALPASARIEFTVPAGTTVVSSPYDFEREEELLDQECRALAPDGTPLTTPSVKQPRARRYVCTARAGAVGATTTFPFTLRIDKKVAHPGGQVTVSAGDSGRPGLDGTAADDTAEVAVAVWPGPAWATPGHYEAAAIVLAMVVLAAALGTWRWKRSHRADTSPDLGGD